MNKNMNKYLIKTFKSYIVVLFLNIFSNSTAQEIDSLNYYQKFNLAVKSYKDKRYALAEEQFKSILINERDYVDPAAQLMIAKSQLKQNNHEGALRICKTFLTSYPKSIYEPDGLILLGDISLKNEKFTEAFHYFLNARRVAKQQQHTYQIDKRILRCIGLGLNEELIEKLLFKEKKPQIRSIINLARAYNSWQKGLSNDLKDDLRAISLKSLPEKFLPIHTNLNNYKNQSIYETYTVSVIVPLEGPSKEKGESYLLGLSDAFNLGKNLTQIKFLVYDTKGRGPNALNIVKKISSNNKSVAILGPLTYEEIYSISGLDTDIPILVPKSAPMQLAEISKNLFFLSPSAKTLAERSAQMIIKELGFSQIAVLSPADRKYKETTDYFINACFQMGVDPVSIEWYLEKPINISKQLKSIRRVAWSLVEEDDNKSEESNLKIDSLDALFDVDVTDFFELPKKEVEVMSKSDSSKINLETIQAIYIPIRPDELRYVGTQLPVYNLTAMVFGNENWLDMNLLNKDIIGPHVQGMRIISDIGSPVYYDTQKNIFKNYFSLAQDHSSFLESLFKKKKFKKKKLVEQLRSQNHFYGEYTSILLDGENKNENTSAQVIEYNKNKIRTLGIYDGDEFRRTKNE